MKLLWQIFFHILFLPEIYCQGFYECPLGWVEHTERCYYFNFHPLRRYAEAAAACQTDGAYLVSINDDEEFNFVSDWLTKHDQNRGNRWWTSGIGKGDTLRWEGDGTPASSSPFFWQDENDLNSLENGENVVFLFTALSSQFKWGRSMPNMMSSFVCEISLNEAYRIVQQDRDHMFGTDITDPNEIKLGPKFIEQPQTLVIEGKLDYAQIECVAHSNPQPTYVWYKSSGVRPPAQVTSNEHYTMTNGKLVIARPDEIRDEGMYQCLATNELGSVISNPISVNFGYLFEFSNDPPGSVTARQYKGTVVSCRTPAYNPAIDVKWYKEDGGANFLRTDLHPHQFVSRNGKFYLSETSTPDAGYYHCFVTLVPHAGQVLATLQTPSRTSLGIHLIIVGDSPSDYGPEIHNDFPAVFPTPALRGEILTLECFAYGKLPLHYSWRKNGGQMPDKAEYSEHGRVITLPNAQLEDAGNYTCRVDRGSSAVAEKSLSVIIEAKPFFAFPLKDQHIDVGRPLTWRCEAMGVPRPTYTWYKNGKQLTESEEDVEVRINILTIASAQPDKHQGMYQCGATNAHGTTISSAQLRVLSFKPSFAKRPMNPYQMGTEGGSVTILCQPEAAPAPILTWKKNGAPLSASGYPAGRISQLSNGNLVIKDLHAIDKGTYECTAVNEKGSASSSGVLTVVAKTVMTVKPSDTRVNVNGTAFLACQSSFDPKVKDVVYVWDLNAHPIDYTIEPHFSLGTSGTVTGLYITNAQVYHTGTYGCSAISVEDVMRYTAYLQVFGPPGECGGVIAQVTGWDAAIKWALGPNNMAEISKFQIEYNTNFNSSWRVLKDDITKVGALDPNRNGRCIYEVKGLKPGSSYRFRVIAVNLYGPSPPSLASSFYKIPDAAPVIPVTGIREGWGPVGTLVVEWDPLPLEDLTGNDIGYKIYYRKKDVNSEVKWSVGEVLGMENKYSALVGVDNYYLEYEIKIAAFNALGQGPNSSVQVIMSQGDMPVGVPSNVFIEPYNSTAFVVHWTPIPLLREYIRGRVIGYGINYWKPGESMETSNMYCTDDCSSEIIVGLEPTENYWVNVQVVTTAGMGTLSEDYYAGTNNFPPQFFPEYVHVSSHSGNAVFVLWKGISTGLMEESLIGYKLRWWPSTEDIRKANITVVPDRSTQTVIHGLASGTIYSLRVSGYSSGGDGANSPTTYFTLEGQVMYNPATTDIMNTSPSLKASLLLICGFGLWNLFLHSTNLPLYFFK
ncbi:unnamed protein product [Lymnaea stagnalis]|uniref:Contactin n=1 Tax=Lymnaea stagnalis TaxID=6523 RepID=A0AAV2HKC2_LYMST